MYIAVSPKNTHLVVEEIISVETEAEVRCVIHRVTPPPVDIYIAVEGNSTQHRGEVKKIGEERNAAILEMVALATFTKTYNCMQMRCYVLWGQEDNKQIYESDDVQLNITCEY